MRRLGSPHLRPVRGAGLVMAPFVNLRRRSLLPKSDRVSLCMLLQQNVLLSVHSRQTHACSIALCKEYLHQISWNANKSLVADARYLAELRTDGSCLREERSFCYFVTNPKIWHQALGTSEYPCVTLYTNYITSILVTEKHFQKSVNRKANSEHSAAC
jgi:hypothetical protein